MEGDETPAYVPVRPYSKECAASGEQCRERKTFRPKPPSENRNIERGFHSSTPGEETVQSLLRDSSRRLENDFGGARSREAAKPQRFQGMALKKFGLGAGASASSSAAAAGSAAAPRKMKEWKEGKSTELMDLAFMGARGTSKGGKAMYAPISLPYYNMTQEEPGEEDDEQSSAHKKKRPEMKNVDEENANAAKELFLDGEGSLQEDNIILIQLPSVLPELLDPLEEVRREQEDGVMVGAGHSITRLPDGLMGKLRIHKSGKVVMEIGGLPFCVDQGCDTFFRQDLACVCPLAGEVVQLGSIKKRMVLTPDVEAMLADISGGSASGSTSVAQQ
mmetsp:Transcript_75595/g.162060  ORF Transcript_75595/g.162060 Transcript_75595/m.162060 type:complete len:333 (+) Transcript_75595:115-1113(+)